MRGDSGVQGGKPMPPARPRGANRRMVAAPTPAPHIKA